MTRAAGERSEANYKSAAENYPHYWWLRLSKPHFFGAELVGVLWQFRFQFSFCHNFCGNFVFKNQFATLLPDFFRPGETSEMFKLSISTDCLVRHYLLSLQLFNNDQNKTELDQ
jgi:hypothetical protein